MDVFRVISTSHKIENSEFLIMALVFAVKIHERGADLANALRHYVPQWVDRKEDESSGRMEEEEAFEGGGSSSGSGDDDLETLMPLPHNRQSALSSWLGFRVVFVGFSRPYGQSSGISTTWPTMHSE